MAVRLIGLCGLWCSVSSNIPDFKNIDDAKTSASLVSLSLDTQIKAVDALLENYYKQLDSLSNVTDRLQQIANEPFISTLKQQVSVLQAQQENLYQSAKQETNGKADVALSDNGVLFGTSLQEYNQKVVNNIYLSTIAKGSTNISITDQAELSTIAHQCIYLGGRAVYEARSMYAMFSNEIYDDMALCNAVGIQARVKPRDKIEAAKSTDIRIYPNPSTGKLYVSLPDVQKGSILSITDVLGKVVEQTVLRDAVNTLDFDLSAGIYFIRITQDDYPTYNTKLIIVKP